uniref:Large ribosomal subunit protein uL22m n=1 Tax=Sinocyclocheilus rhinocerous TaxID=307959 RepID=A0A673FQ06_9TELE
MWYLAKLIRGMTIDQALTQLEFNDKKGAKIIKEVILEAQDMAVRNLNVEYKSNLYIVHLLLFFLWSNVFFVFFLCIQKMLFQHFNLLKGHCPQMPPHGASCVSATIHRV